MNPNEIVSLTKANLLAGIDKALHDFKIAAFTKKQSQRLYDYINASDEIVFGCQPTVLSPKKFFFPQNETLLEFTGEGKFTPKIESFPQVLFGIHPCDLNGIKILDEAFADGHGDPNYLSKRENTLIIGLDCNQLCDDHAFCFKTNSHEAKGGYDVMLHHGGSRFIAEIATEKGKTFIQKYFEYQPADASALDAFKAEKKKTFEKEKPFKNLEKFPALFEENKDHAVWDEEGKRCLSCGSCIMVCPTCYCFDVADEFQLNLKKGERLRRWDACMLSPFAVVAGGENFRPEAKERLKHRINRKFNYLMKKHGQSVCVGCGRCVRACLAEISPRTIAEKINGESK